MPPTPTAPPPGPGKRNKMARQSARIAREQADAARQYSNGRVDRAPGSPAPTLPNEQNQMPAGPRGKQTITGRGGRDFQIDRKLYDTIPANARARAMDTFRKQGVGGLKDQFGNEPWGGELVSAIAGARQNAPGARPTAKPAGGFAADPGTFVPGDKTGKPAPGVPSRTDLPFGKPGVSGGGQGPMAPGVIDTSEGPMLDGKPVNPDGSPRTPMGGWSGGGITDHGPNRNPLGNGIVAALPPQQKTSGGEVEGNPPEPGGSGTGINQFPQPLAGPAAPGLAAGQPPVRQPVPTVDPRVPAPGGGGGAGGGGPVVGAPPPAGGYSDMGIKPEQFQSANAAFRALPDAKRNEVQMAINEAIASVPNDGSGARRQAIYSVYQRFGLAPPMAPPNPGPGGQLPPGQSPPFNPNGGGYNSPPFNPFPPVTGGGGPVANTPPIYVPPALPQSAPAPAPQSQFPDIFGTAF